MEFGPVRFQGDGTVVAVQRLLCAVRGAQQRAAVEMRPGDVGPQRDRPIVAEQGVAPAAQRKQSVASIIERLRIARVERDRAVVAGDGAFESAHRLEHDAEIAVERRLRARYRDRALDHVDSPRMVAPLMGGKPGKMERRGVLRVFGESLLVEGFRSGDRPATVKRRAAIDQSASRDRRQFWEVPGHAPSGAVTSMWSGARPARRVACAVR
jgi:hypothetical protein